MSEKGKTTTKENASSSAQPRPILTSAAHGINASLLRFVFRNIHVNMSLDVPQLKTASTYVNNLLLARGLLRNGKAVDFAVLGGAEKERNSRNPPKDAERAAEIINLVHDLILRRDARKPLIRQLVTDIVLQRETEQWSSLSETLTDLRSTTAIQSAQFERLKSQNNDLTRQIGAAQASAKSAHTALSAAESGSKSLREELGRVKATLAQVRTQCANDVRKRDVQLQKLKAHLSTSQRGSNGRPIPSTCTIVGGSSLEKRSANSHTGSLLSGGSHHVGGDSADQPPSLEDAEYSLKQETTEFLTQLSQNLSDENDSLLTLVRNTIGTLRELQNLPPGGSQKPNGLSNNSDVSVEDDMVFVIPNTYQALHADLEYVLASLKVILTNASFVPIDEVYARDEEIVRLRDGWERMESRWEEAVEMMKGWRERMLNGGGTVNLEELKLGLGLGDGLQHLTDIPPSPSTNSAGTKLDDEGLDVPELPEDEPSFVAEEEQLRFETRPNGDDHLFEEEDGSSSPFGPSPLPSALKESTNKLNVLPRSGHPTTKEKGAQEENDSAYPAPPPEDALNTADSAGLEAKQQKRGSSHTRVKMEKRSESTSSTSRGEGAVVSGMKPRVPSAVRQSSTDKSRKPLAERQPISNFPSKARSASHTNPRRNHPSRPKPSVADDEEQVPLTIEQKLKHAESEARRISGGSASPDSHPGSEGGPANGSSEDAMAATEADDKQQVMSKDQPPATSQRHEDTTVPPVPDEKQHDREPEAPSSHDPSPPQANTTTAGNAAQAKPTARARTAASTAAVRGGTLPRTTRGTTTTRIPTKPAAPEHATRAKLNTHAPGAPSLLEEGMLRSRRKRKSTLSPEELEELMGLRRDADDDDAAMADCDGASVTAAVAKS